MLLLLLLLLFPLLLFSDPFLSGLSLLFVVSDEGVALFFPPCAAIRSGSLSLFLLLLLVLIFRFRRLRSVSFLAAIVSSCSSSDVLVADVALSIGTSIAWKTDFPDRFGADIMDTRAELVGVFERLFPVSGMLRRCWLRVGS